MFSTHDGKKKKSNSNHTILIQVFQCNDSNETIKMQIMRFKFSFQNNEIIQV